MLHDELVAFPRIGGAPAVLRGRAGVVARVSELLAAGAQLRIGDFEGLLGGFVLASGTVRHEDGAPRAGSRCLTPSVRGSSSTIGAGPARAPRGRPLAAPPLRAATGSGRRP